MSAPAAATYYLVALDVIYIRHHERSAMDGEEIRLFHNDDEGYEEWVPQHEGYILTAPRRGEYMPHDSKVLAPR